MRHERAPPPHPATSHPVVVLVDDAAALYQHLVSEGVAIVSPLRDADYGMRTFVFADPDGNRMDVGQYL